MTFDSKVGCFFRFSSGIKKYLLIQFSQFGLVETLYSLALFQLSFGCISVFVCCKFLIYLDILAAVYVS